MRLRRLWGVVTCCILLAGAIVYNGAHRSGGAQPKLQIAVTDQRLVSDSLVVSVIASNTGPRTLVNGGACEVRYEMEGVWTTNSFGGERSSLLWLLPGESRRQKFSLPRRVTRFQVGYSFDVACTRVSLACQLAEHGWLDRMRWALNMLPSHPAEYRDFWGPECGVAPNLIDARMKSIKPARPFGKRRQATAAQCRDHVVRAAKRKNET